MTKTNCKKCGKEFFTKKYRISGEKKICCSRVCHGEMKRGTKLSQETRAKMSEAQKGEKHHKYWLGKTRSPEHIQKMIAGIKRNAKGIPFCSANCGKRVANYGAVMCKRCWGPNHRGEKNGQWKGGIAFRKKDNDRRSSAYAGWRLEVWRRDNFKCRIANKDCDGRIEAHHILGWTEYVELRYEINNGITLCHAQVL